MHSESPYAQAAYMLAGLKAPAGRLLGQHRGERAAGHWDPTLFVTGRALLVSQPDTSSAEGGPLPTCPHPHSGPGRESPVCRKKAEAQPSSCFLNRWLPESARWLIVTGKPEQGLQELHKVARINGHKEATKSLTIQVSCSCS